MKNIQNYDEFVQEQIVIFLVAGLGLSILAKD